MTFLNFFQVHRDFSPAAVGGKNIPTLVLLVMASVSVILYLIPHPRILMATAKSESFCTSDKLSQCRPH